MMFNLFGKKAEPVQQKQSKSRGATDTSRGGVGSPAGNNVLDQIASHSKLVESLEKREAHLQNKINICVAEAKKKAASGDKKGAMMQLRRKKMYEQEIDALNGSRMQLEKQQIAMESASVNNATIQAISKGNKVMSSTSADVDQVAEILDELDENIQISSETSDALARPAQDAMEDDDLLEELAALTVEADVEDQVPIGSQTKAAPPSTVFSKLPAAPNAPVAAPATASTEEDEEEKAFRELQASMGLT
jgi:charged multivesicular body protein 4